MLESAYDEHAQRVAKLYDGESSIPQLYGTILVTNDSRWKLPFPSWLHHAVDHWNVFGSADQQEIIEDAVTVAIMDQIGAGLDVITDGEQTRLDFNLSHGFQGISLESASPRRWGHWLTTECGRHAIVGPFLQRQGDLARLRTLSA